MGEALLRLENIYKRFGNHTVLDDVSLTVDKGDVVTLLGPSGTGKTTLLRCINLLETPERGRISIDRQTIDFEHLHKKDVVPFRQNTAMVFQHFNLLRNKTVLENVTEGLTVVQKKSGQEAREIALEELAKVSMSDKLDAYPSEISGGQQQRVGIARAMALRPKILLLDEPTSALDPELVSEVLEIIRRIAASGTTMVIVTHEVAFARNAATRAVLMEEGHIVEQGPPGEFCEHPKEERTVQFLQRIMQDACYRCPTH